MTNNHRSWCIKFEDEKPPHHSWVNNEEAAHYMHGKLHNAYQEINKKVLKTSSSIPIDRILYT